MAFCSANTVFNHHIMKLQIKYAIVLRTYSDKPYILIIAFWHKLAMSGSLRNIFTIRRIAVIDKMLMQPQI